MVMVCETAVSLLLSIELKRFWSTLVLELIILALHEPWARRRASRRTTRTSSPNWASCSKPKLRTRMDQRVRYTFRRSQSNLLKSLNLAPFRWCLPPLKCESRAKDSTWCCRRSWRWHTSWSRLGLGLESVHSRMKGVQELALLDMLLNSGIEYLSFGGDCRGNVLQFIQGKVWEAKEGK